MPFRANCGDLMGTVISTSMERTIVGLAVLAIAAGLLLRFGADATIVALVGPWVGAVLAYWYVGNKAASDSENANKSGKP